MLCDHNVNILLYKLPDKPDKPDKPDNPDNIPDVFTCISTCIDLN